jgi:hypothetical protein
MSNVTEEYVCGRKNKVKTETENEEQEYRNEEKKHRPFKSCRTCREEKTKNKNEGNEREKQINEGKNSFLKRENIFRYINLFYKSRSIDNRGKRKAGGFGEKIKEYITRKIEKRKSALNLNTNYI